MLEGLLQGNVLAGYGTPCARFLFAEVTDAARARRWIGGALERVTTHPSTPELTLNLAFTHAGLLALGVPADRFAGLGSFAAGMAARADYLGDRGASAPERWEAGLRAGRVHVAAVLSANQPDQLTDAVRALALDGLRVVHDQHAASLPDGREHFGFGDGFSQPAVAGADTGPRVGEGTLTRWGWWRRLPLGEFVLGHPGIGGRPAPAPAGALGEAATFMVVRKLAQDVAAFGQYARVAGAQFGRDQDWVAAKLVGRWQNGSALVRYPDAPGPPAIDDARASRFRYGYDPHGAACPLGSHVRRANPRDALGSQGRLTQRHRIIRRGISYGPPLGEAAADRGLIFVCYQASLERQFEFVQHEWLGDGNVFRLGDERDPLVGATPRAILIQGEPPRFLTDLPDFVTTRGGDYFLLPGLDGLRALAAGTC